MDNPLAIKGNCGGCPDSDRRGLIGGDCERGMGGRRGRPWTRPCLGTGRAPASCSALLRVVHLGSGLLLAAERCQQDAAVARVGNPIVSATGLRRSCSSGPTANSRSAVTSASASSLGAVSEHPCPAGCRSVTAVVISSTALSTIEVCRGVRDQGVVTGQAHRRPGRGCDLLAFVASGRDNRGAHGCLGADRTRTRTR